MSRVGLRRRLVPVVSAVAVVGLVGTVSSCSKAPTYSDQVGSSARFDDLLKPTLAVTEWADKPLVDNAIGIQPGAPIKVSSTGGALTSVSIDKSDGSALKGNLSEDGFTWTSTEPFGYNKRYTLNAKAAGVGGESMSKVSFTTRAPQNLTQAYLMPHNGETVGIAQPVAVKFDEPIKNKKTAQAAIKIVTEPAVDGAFYWISDQEVRWRPQGYWKTGTKVNVAVNTYGLDLGNGLFGQENVRTSFKIGRSVVIKADDRTKQVTFFKDGKVVRTMPTSMGKDSTPTDNGTYIVGDKHSMLVMDSSTYGVPVNSPAGYRTPVDFATQMSYSGIYFHSAPWSVWAQGNTNTSHGCLNLSPDNAQWVMNYTLRGDPVEVRNTVGPKLSGTDGLGDWNVPWAVWSKGNA
ncbi:L,D-transpeptidase [Gordonia sp. TBRC 11910]|uniref:L,D-transpeptidase n=1 Tax=Gordonia asplenii TaxID=2725283 RepID=A0A848L561_9ACTN|nr:Ig-like domain-containing protein [Gordonia asplenii]NMO03763.1 L,D-transpeptidase [Gordonia asplenii]